MFNIGEPLWLSGKVMEWQNKTKSKDPGFAPQPGEKMFYIRDPTAYVKTPVIFSIYILPW
jgi:hypothetical protein